MTSAVLTADLCAHAVIAAARIYGDDPEFACVTQIRSLRRSLAPAAIALANVLKVERRKTCAPFGLRVDNVSRAEGKGGEIFASAVRAAEDALAPIACAPFHLRPVQSPFTRAEPETSRGGVRVVKTAVEPPPLAQSTEGLILLALANGRPMNTMSLASIIDRKEMVVTSALLGLLAAKRVVETRVEDGPRRFVYSLAELVTEPEAPPRDLKREIIDILHCEPCSGGDLVEILDAPEADVRVALEELSEHREVRATKLTQEGWAARFWRLAEGADA